MSLSAERVPEGVKYTKTHEDGSTSSAILVTWTQEEIDSFRSHLPAAYAKIRRENMMKSWWGRLRLWYEKRTGFDPESLYR